MIFEHPGGGRGGVRGKTWDVFWPGFGPFVTRKIVQNEKKCLRRSKIGQNYLVSIILSVFSLSSVTWPYIDLINYNLL
jgi:hypothetical protein